MNLQLLKKLIGLRAYLDQNRYDCNFNFNYVDILLSVLLSLLSKGENPKNRNYLRSISRDLIVSVKNLIPHTRFTYSNDFPQLDSWDFIFFVVEPTEVEQLLSVARYCEGKFHFLFITNRIKLFKSISTKYPVVLIKQRQHAKFKGNHGVLKAIETYSELNPAEKKIVTDCLRSRMNYFNDLQSCLLYLLHRYKPKAAFVGYDITPEGRLLGMMCKNMNIPGFVIQHGAIPSDPIYKEHLVDKVFVFGEVTNDKLSEIGLESSKIVVTGAPYLDLILRKPRSNVSKLQERLGIHDHEPFILVAISGPGHRTSRTHFNKFVQALKKLIEFSTAERFIIKLHRKDTLLNYGLFEDFQDTGKVIMVQHDAFDLEDVNIFDWINCSEVIITGNSTVVIEAMLMKKTVLTVDLNDEYKGVDFIDAGATIHCTSEDQFINSFFVYLKDRQAFNDVASKAAIFINRYFYKCDGRASERIINYIESNYLLV